MKHKILIVGGAGFIGINAAKRFMMDGWDVTIVDNLSRAGCMNNLEWLKHQGKYSFEKLDVRDYKKLVQIFQTDKFNVVLHLAAQVAVTKSIDDPRTDFDTNAVGTFNLLEAIRQFNPQAFLIYASSNKVYGDIENAAVIRRNGRYEYSNLPDGIDENTPLNFHCPYGCSKGTADQYVLNYSRIYGIPSVVFRQSCIYGPRQFGIEDQGWLAWFMIAAVLGKQITIYGDGKQVRDILHVDDLIGAFQKATEKKDIISGNAFNIGGGPHNTIALLELIKILEKRLGYPIPITFEEERVGDQKVFICNISKAYKMFNWSPVINVETGVYNHFNWVKEHKSLFS